MLKILAALAGVILVVTPGRAQTDHRIPVKTADDLPRHRYRVTGTALDFLNDQTRFNKLRDQLITASLADLKKYRIEDRATLRAYYDILQTAYESKGDLQRSLAISDKARELEDNDQEKFTCGLSLRARIAATQVTSDVNDPRFAEAFKTELRRQISAVPYEPIKDKLVMLRGLAKMVTRQRIESSLTTELDPVIAANQGKVPEKVAVLLVSTKLVLDSGLRELPWVAEVYGEVIDAHAGVTNAPDLWTPRLVALEKTAKAQPVVVGIWDTGVDTSLYPDQLWTNPGETLNGKDDDGNGFVDDLHGIAFGPDHRPTTGSLVSLGGLHGDKAQGIQFLIANEDMQAGIQNEGVTAFQTYVKGLVGEKLRYFTEDMSLLDHYCHGTHVAGVAVAGNPFARIVYVTENNPSVETLTIEGGARWGASAQQAVDYLKKSGARVVNMSWRVSREMLEGELNRNGVGGTPAERAELSRQIFAGLRNGLEAAMRSAPGILFVAGSGNEDNDVDFAEYIPAGLRLPNLITIGAVDDHDKFTSFTSTGKNVELYANGYRVESFIPGGQRVKFSGTSMASPQVVNLAAKLFALKPELTPAQVMSLIHDHADPVPGQPGRFVINPKRTIQSIKL